MENQEQQTMNQEQETQNQDPIIKIGETEYKYSELNDEQKLMVNHVADLGSKISSARFNLEQLQFARAAFEDQLAKSLKDEAEAEEVETEEV